MKISKTFRLSEEALAKLDAQSNATQYLEDLILGAEHKSLQVVPLHQLQALLEAEFEKLGKLPQVQPVDPLDALASQVFVPRPPDPLKGYPCCEGKSPCKHWVWDSGLAVYSNSITGAKREAEL